MLSDFELTEKLYERCCPVLQNRIATELMDKLPNDFGELMEQVLTHPEVQQNINYYVSGARLGMAGSYSYPKLIHGSKPEQLENVVGKLWSLGIRKGVPAIDEFLDTYIANMEYDFYGKNIMRVGYGIYQIAQLLGLLGYAGNEKIFSILQARLDQLFAFVQQGRYDIYVDIKDYPKPPSTWRDITKIVDPALTRYGDAEGEPPLPFLSDIIGILGMKQAGLTEENEMKINEVLRYCFDERYQIGVNPGYGILLAPTGNYYSMGWSVHLPGYGQRLSETINMKQLLLLADMLSNFEVAKELSLFKELLNFLENYRDKDGFYSFPKEFIPEEKTGYFILGKHMGLGENRRQKEAYVNESTFRVLKIKKNLRLFT